MSRIHGILVAITLGPALGCSSSGPVGALSAPSEATPRVPTVVVTAAIPLGTPITEDRLAVVDWPQSLVPADSFQALDRVHGRRARIPLQPGDLVRSSLIADHDTSSSASGRVPLGMRLLLVDGPPPPPGASLVDLWYRPAAGPCAAVQGATLVDQNAAGAPALVVGQAQVGGAIAAVHHPSFQPVYRRSDDIAPHEELRCR